MWEICIDSNSGNKDYIKYINEQMVNTINSLNAVVGISKDGTSISFGCKKEDSQKLWGVLRFVLCEIFCDKMKYKYLFKNVTIVSQSEGFFNALIKVLTYFDSEIERQIVLRSIKYSPKIVLESYLNFKLKPLKSKWKELCNLTNNNSVLFLQSETFIELLKFLISNLEIKKECVVVSFKSPCIVYEEKQNSIISINTFDLNDEFGIISELIEMCPQRIKLIANNNARNIINLLSELFDGRVEIIKDN